jgi:hypothetical protein
MQIKPSEGAAVAPLSSTRPAAEGKLALETRARNVLISLSGKVLALSAALTPELLDLRALALDTALTAEDRLLLAKLSELASAEQMDPGEVARLALDLSRYRARAEAPQAPAPALLELPTFSTHDEALARTILASVALRASALERGFVRALLDPDQTREHVVDFAFLRRALVALSPARDAALDPGVSFERRDARTALARALELLALPRTELPEAARGAELGAALLRQRLPALLARAHDDGATASGAPSATPDAAQALPRQDAGPSTGAARLPLTRSDRALLGLLYAAARGRGQDPSAVDEVARALVRLRVLERSDAHAQTERRPLQLDRGSHDEPGALGPAHRDLRSEQRVLQPADDVVPTEPAAPERAIQRTPGETRAPGHTIQGAPTERAIPSARPAEGAPVGRTPGETRAPERTIRGTPGERAIPSARPPEGAPVGLASDSAIAAHDARTVIGGEVPDGAPDALPVALARSFGSSSQLAARAGGTYRSLAPPSMTWSVPAPAGSVEAAARAEAPLQNAAPALPTLSRPFDLAAALGLGSLVRDVRAHSLRGARSRLLARRRGTVRAIEAPLQSASEADADDPLLHDSPRRERARWRLLLSRRRRARVR